MSGDILLEGGGGVHLKFSDDDADADAEFEQHNVDVEAILARTQRSFGSRSRRHMHLYEAPEFIKRLNALEQVCVGDTVIFSCQWQGLPKPTMKWYKDDQEITEDSRYDFEEDETERGKVKLVMKNAKKKDEGAYKCKAENQEGVASTTGYLSVSGGSDCDERTLASKKKEQAKQMRKATPDHTVSSAPHLRTIIEQQSVEEREAESLRNQPPSPIQDFIDHIQTGRGRGGVTWPLMGAMSYQNDDDAASTGSETSVESQDFDRVCFSLENEDDVFTDEIPRRELHLLNGTDAHVSTDNSAHAQQISSTHNGSVLQNGVTANSRSTPEIMVSHAKDHRKAGKKSRGTEHRRRITAAQRMPSLDIDLFGVLDTPWIYFFPIVSSATFYAASTEVNPLFLIIFMIVASVAVFHFFFKRDDT